MDQYGGNAARRTNEFGNQTTDAHGKPIGQQGYGHETGGPGTGTGGAVTHGSGGTAQMMHPERHQQEKKGGILHRSGSSSSSSSDEDDGMGGRRKKGLKEKIKEKLPGQHQKTDEFGQPIQGQGQGHTATGYGGTGTGTGTGTGIGAGGYYEPEKRGVVDKVKEKLPGNQNQRTDEYGQPIQGQGHTTGHGATGTGYGGTGTGNGGYHEPEKRGVVDKVKEKLPGHQTQRTDEYGQPIQGQGHTTGHGATGTGTGTGYGGTGTGTGTAGYREPEKKGMMEKIKEKLPGQH